MRFAELELLKYGRFEGCHLRFASGVADLQIVFGPNEAGKSTTMAAIGDLLFGFPHATPYDFRFDKQLLRVGAKLEANGAEFTCRRKKGRSGTLLDTDDQVLDEGVLTGMLAGYSAESFQRMFSLDHTRLREGGRAILAAQDDIGQAIFAAGSGLVGVATLLDHLEAESKEIWTKRAGDRRYYAAQHAYDEARARQKAALIKPAAWDDLRQELAQLDARLETLRERRRELEREREEVERRRRVLPHAALYRRAEGELAPLLGVPELPADAGDVLNQAATALATADAETALAQAQADKARSALDALVLDPRLIERSGEIEALREAKGAVDKSLSDLPRRRAELETRDQRLSELQRELGWPQEPAALVKTRLPQRVRIAELRALLESRTALDATLSGAASDEAAALEANQRLHARLGELPQPRDLGQLSAALRFTRSLGDLDTAIAAAERDLGRRDAALSAGLTQLSPWAGAPDTLRRLVVPTEPQVAAALAEITKAQTVVAQTRRDLQTELDRKVALELQRTHLVRDDSAVSPAVLDHAREDRDALWRQVRSHLVQERALPDPAMTADDFERRSGIADAVADRRYTAAEQSARLTGLQEELERNAIAIAQQERRIAEAQEVVEARVMEWRMVLGPANLDVEPAAFIAWSDRRRRALELSDQAEIAQAALEDASGRRRDAAARILAALADAGADMQGGEPLRLLLQEAERLEAAELEAEQRRRDLRGELAGGEETLKRVATKQQAATASLHEWEERWKPAVTVAGLSTNSSEAVIRAQLDLIEELRGELDEVLSLQRRVSDMEADVISFEDRVSVLAAACGLEARQRAPMELLLHLDQMAREAATAETRRAGLDGQLTAAKRALGDAEAASTRAVALIRPIAECAGTAEPTSLIEAVRKSDRARRLRQELDRLAAEILTAGAGSSLETLLADSENDEATALTVRNDVLQEELRALGDEIACLTGERGTAQANFGRLDDGPDAAIAAADAEQARAEMAAQAEAYVRKRAEAALLRWTISRYRSEKQTPLLKRASSLFSKLTIGRYSELLVDVDGNKARLAGLCHDQSVVPVEGMSEGTVDQLFLALRLAAVEDVVAGGAKLPFLADDLFINYDDDRARAGFAVLAELARSTQVLFFTHHQHLVTLAEGALAPLTVSRCELN